jgi:anti-sigma factor RsiW
MTRFERQREQSGCGNDVAAYVLGALEPDEVRVLREHLSSCAVCRDELATLQGVADALPLAAPPLAVPRRLKRRVMAEIRREPRTTPDGGRSSSPRLSLARPAVALGGALGAAAAVALALLLASSGSSPTRVVQASVTAPGASAVLRLSAGQAALVVHHMPQPPRGKIYEVWLKRGGAAATPTDALFGVTSSGSAAVVVPGNLRGISAVLVTPEPRVGSVVPTHPPVIVAQL